MPAPIPLGNSTLLVSLMEGMVADIVVYGDEIIAGDVQSTAIDGFMEGLTDHAPQVKK